MDETGATNGNELADFRIRTPAPPNDTLPHNSEWRSNRARLALARQEIVPRRSRSAPRECKWISKRARLVAAKLGLKSCEIKEDSNDHHHRRRRYSDCTELEQREDLVFKPNADAVLIEISVDTGIAAPVPSRNTCRSSSIPCGGRSSFPNEEGRNFQEDLSSDPLVVGVASLLRRARLNQGMLRETAEMRTEFEPIDFWHVARLRREWNTMAGRDDEDRTTLGTRSPSVLSESQTSTCMSLVVDHDEEEEACEDDEK